MKGYSEGVAQVRLNFKEIYKLYKNFSQFRKKLFGTLQTNTVIFTLSFVILSTGIAISNDGLVVVNWRSKYITEMTTDGETIKYFTYNAFQEPIDVAVDKSYGHILVADNGMSCVFVFDAEGKILFQVNILILQLFFMRLSNCEEYRHVF